MAGWRVQWVVWLAVATAVLGCRPAPAPPPVDTPPSAEFVAGQRALLAGYPAVALGHFNLHLAASAETPQTAEAHYWMGLCEVRLNHPREALEQFDRALQARDGSAQVRALTLLAAGQAAYLGNEFDRALALFDRITGPLGSLVPPDELAYQRALALRRLSRWGESATLFHQILTRHPDSPRRAEAARAFEFPHRYFTCQIGWFTGRENAEREAGRAQRIGFAARVEGGQRGGVAGYAVLVGQYGTFGDAQAASLSLRRAGFDAFVIP